MHALSPTDSAFLWMETRNQPMHVAGLNIYTPPAGAGSGYVADMLARWSKHLKALTPFNLRPVLKMGIWYWEVDDEFELDYHLRHLALPQPGRIRELLAMVSRLHGNLLDRNRPLWECYVIEGLPGGRFAIYTKIHHALIDGVTGARMMAQSLSPDPQVMLPPVWDIPFSRHPTTRKATPKKGLSAQIAAWAQAGRDILPGIGTGLWDMLRAQVEETAQGMPFQAPPTPFNVQISGSRRFAAQSYALARFKRIGEAAQATINDVTLAVCAGALRRHLLAQDALPHKPLVAMVPVSLHDQTDAGGNQVSLLLANLATHMGDPLERLHAIVASTQEAKHRLSTMPRLQKLAHGITSISGMGPAMVTGVARKHPLFNVVISNVPGPRETLFLNGARLDEVYPVSIATHYLALNITINGYGDQLGFGFIACRRSVPALQRMLDYTEQSLRELEAALGLHQPPSGTKPRTTRTTAAKKIATTAPAKKEPAALKPAVATATKTSRARTKALSSKVHG